MNELTIHIYSSDDVLPANLLEDDFFHSAKLFALSKATPRHRPYMAVVTDANAVVVAQLLALVRYRSSWLPPYFYMHCRILGEGAFRKDDGSETVLRGHAHERSEKEAERQALLFEMMLEQLKERMGSNVLFMEVSNLSQKMFGYSAFRKNGFFPVKWMSIHNSLHSRKPEERIGERLKKRIEIAERRGVTTQEVSNEKDFRSFSRLLRHHHWFKPRRYVPDDHFFRSIQQGKDGSLLITKYRERVIGCSAIVYSQQQAYLWYAAFRRKSFAPLHPDDVTIWHTINHAYEKGYEHIYFMDVGLPFEKNPYREFILSFGGKPVSTFRWFRCSIGWINRLLSWIYGRN
jgi:hypothetical protein